MNDRSHFDEYREQTEAKHTILEKYIFAFLNILKGNNTNLVYIDGFAGRGSYQSTATGAVLEGSPLRALRKVASSPDLASRVSFVFIEKDQLLADQLKTSVDNFYKDNSHIREPHVAVGAFAKELNRVLDDLASNGSKLAPTFLFVDPCGVAGASFEAIERFMKNDSCEVFVFFNIEGVRRILGLEKMGSTLAELLGSHDRARELQALVEMSSTAQAREDQIVTHYETLLRSGTGAEYVTSFRFEYEDRRSTSHYLIHATKHPHGFRIMKDVMWSVGRTAEGTGGLEFEQKSMARPLLFKPKWDSIKNHVSGELVAGARRVSHFYTDLARQPQNKLCEMAYREALLALEAEQRIVVLAKDGLGTIAPKRRAKTLGADYYVRLTTDAERSRKAPTR